MAEEEAKIAMDNFIFRNNTIDTLHDQLIKIIKKYKYIPEICFDTFYSRHILWIQLAVYLIDETEIINGSIPKNEFFIISVAKNKPKYILKLINYIDIDLINRMREQFPNCKELYQTIIDR